MDNAKKKKKNKCVEYQIILAASVNPASINVQVIEWQRIENIL